MIVLLFMALFLAGSEARADIYRYLDKEGVECFTDTPVVNNAVRIIKERPPRHKTPVRQKLSPPPHSTETAHLARTDPDFGHGRCDAETVLPVRGIITSTVGLRHDPIDGVLRDHKGVDIATPEGTPIRPIAAGVVTFSGYRHGYGNTVIVKHDDGMITIYAHNSANLKTEGELVDKGSTIAFSGSTGRTTGPHLHFEAWKDGVNVTTSFIPGGAAPRENDGFRRIIQADGTLVFTNLP